MLQFLFIGQNEAQRQMNSMHLTYFWGLIMMLRRIDEGELASKQIIQRKHIMQNPALLPNEITKPLLFRGEGIENPNKLPNGVKCSCHFYLRVEKTLQSLKIPAFEDCF